MAKTRPDSGDTTWRSADVPDQTVSMVGKAAMEVMKLRESFTQNMAAAQTDEERQNLAEQAETAAVRAISEQGITVAEYNEVIGAAQSDPELEERVLTACRQA
jgi:Domain of unknown function (DUF4168)